MKIGTWLKHIIFGVPPMERRCRNCQFYDPDLAGHISEQHPVYKHHLLDTAQWHPKGVSSGTLGFCTKQNIATAETGLSCEFWVERKHD